MFLQMSRNSPPFNIFLLYHRILQPQQLWLMHFLDFRTRANAIVNAQVIFLLLSMLNRIRVPPAAHNNVQMKMITALRVLNGPFNEGQRVRLTQFLKEATRLIHTAYRLQFHRTHPHLFGNVLTNTFSVHIAWDLPVDELQQYQQYLNSPWGTSL